jgi:hypothetical protein
MFENSSSESVEQSAEFLAERAKDSESNRCEGSTAGVDDRLILGIFCGYVSFKDVVKKSV